MFRWLAPILAFGFFASIAPAATTTIQFTVAAGKENRTNEPVTVTLTVPKEFEKVHTVLVGKGAKVYTFGQLTAPSLGSEEKAPGDGKVNRELQFIVSSLRANATLELETVLNTEEPDAILDKSIPDFHWTNTKDESHQLDLGTTPVLRYVCKPLDTSSKDSRDETFKVFHHLFDPAGKQLVTGNGDKGDRYPHHRGLFYGFREVTYDEKKKVDIWHCPVAYQEHEKTLATEAGPVLGRHRVLIAWHGEGKDVFAYEERELTVYHLPGGTLVEFASRLKTTGGTVKLDGDPQHSGFHFRAAQEVAAHALDKTKKPETIYIRPDGEDKPGATRNWEKGKDETHKNLPWDAMSFVLGDKRYTAAYLDHPNNPKEARDSERDYGRFGSYFVAEVTKEKPLTVHYRIWLQEGKMSVAEVAALSEAFVAPVKVTVK
jgi:hypothetical protein